jgi:hypothetical protein
VRRLVVIHHLVAMVLVKGSLVCLGSILTAVDILFKALLVNEIGTLIPVLGRKSLSLICITAGVLARVSFEVGRRVDSWTLAHLKVRGS